MSWWQAVILGIVEGLTEYLPVSSTGHLILTQRVLGLPVDSVDQRQAANAYAICIQGGAILAVLGLYWPRVWQMLQGLAGKLGLGPGDPEGFDLWRNIVVAFLPAAVIGLLFDDYIEQRLFGLWPIVAAWLGGGLVILGVSWWNRRRRHSQAKGGIPLHQLSTRMALMIGLMQCVAMWPGTSRSLATILGGLLAGLSLAAAVEFSFLLGVVTLLAATVYKAKDAGETMLAIFDLSSMLIGALAAWLSAVVAVKWMVAYLKTRDMAVFGHYRIVLALVTAAGILAGLLPPA
jgi:undecaprenyl-diphosphatase